MWTGLRRSEITALRWGDIDLGGAIPRFRLRAATTKSKRADTLVIHPQLTDALPVMQPVDASADTPVVRGIPSMKAFKADLALAGIEYGDRASGYADFHGLRKTLSTMLAAAGLSQRVRQAHLRHTDPRLTDGTYMDERLLPVAAELLRVPPIPDAGERDAEAIPMRATGTDDSSARNMHESCGTHRQTGARGGKMTDRAESEGQGYGAHAQALTSTGFGKQGHGAAPGGNAGSSKAGEGT